MEKFVDYATYCSLCKHKDVDHAKDPCNECLTYPVNEDSRKPIKYEEE